jgi:hypothetical protein
MPFGDMVIDKIEMWPHLSICLQVPVAVSQSRIMPLSADATVLLSGKKATDQTARSWPSSVCVHLPVEVSQSLTVLSNDADARVVQFGEKVRQLIPALWPSSMCFRMPESASQSRIVPSLEADAKVMPSGDMAADQIGLSSSSSNFYSLVPVAIW